jgi:hypothetical protein
MSFKQTRPSIQPNKPFNSYGVLIMKLTDRNISHEVPVPNQGCSVKSEQPKIKLIYRGNTFEHTPYPEIILDEDEADWPTVTLIYRGVTYERKLQPPKPYQKPRAINWRWQFD